MDIKCPHCGTEYEVGQREFGKYVTCQICNKGFVAGTIKRESEPTRITSISSKPRHIHSGRTRTVSDVIQREYQEWIQEKERNSALIVVIVALAVVALVVLLIVPVMNSVAKDAVWKSRLPDAIKLEQLYEPTQEEVRHARAAMSNPDPSVKELRSIGRGMSASLLKGIGRAFDCPSCGKLCRIPSGLKYRVGEERDCQCPYCHKRFRHALR